MSSMADLLISAANYSEAQVKNMGENTEILMDKPSKSKRKSQDGNVDDNKKARVRKVHRRSIINTNRIYIKQRVYRSIVSLVQMDRVGDQTINSRDLRVVR
jgi:hypothetical protein